MGIIRKPRYSEAVGMKYIKRLAGSSPKVAGETAIQVCWGIASCIPKAPNQARVQKLNL